MCSGWIEGEGKCSDWGGQEGRSGFERYRGAVTERTHDRSAVGH